MSSKIALMACTYDCGGMRSVVEGYERDGLFERWGFESLWTNREGSAYTRLIVGFKAYIRLLWILLRDRVSFMRVHAAMCVSFWKSHLSLQQRDALVCLYIRTIYAREFIFRSVKNKLNKIIQII